ncbi:MAG: homoserine kinase [Leptospiraceae bacterium]|nr:homoserine kinase [Leptospiraceae bacterium]MDW7975628.1 homoserine kinase [Leptospiraceae bacterium]
MNSLFFRIPATSANLGPGFDVFGLALNLYNYFYVDFSDEANFEIYDPQNEILPYSVLSQNLIYQAYKNQLQKKGFFVEEFPKWNVTIATEVSIGKGFGSSASAIVAGSFIAKKVLEKKNQFLTLEEEIENFLDLENHPDNVVPARIGGWVFCYSQKHFIKKSLPENLGLCALIPDFEIRTSDSRKKLKTHYEREDALSNIKGCLLWLEYIHSKNPEYLKLALQSDRLHEPYRYPEIPYIKDIRDYVLGIGCYGMSLSGSGPGLMIYYDKSKEKYFQKKLLHLQEELNRNKENHFHLKFCLPDYEGLALLREPIDFENFYFQQKETMTI